MTPLEFELVKAWAGTEFEGRVFLVGGCVRDEILGFETSHDIDIVIDGDALGAVEVLFQKGLSEHKPVLFPRFGTAMLTIAGTNIEFVTARKESYLPTSRKPEVEPASLLQDAMRRDFTVNTLMKNIFTGERLDLTGTGISDLTNKLLRTPSDPETTFFDDPLRMIRGVRFKYQLGFSFVPGLEDAIQKMSNRLSVLSYERIRDELVKILKLPNASEAVADLMRLNLLPVFAPETVPMVGCIQGHQHHLDVWGHSLLALESAGNRDMTLSLATLLHDIGKPNCKTTETNGTIRFIGHEIVGAEIARTLLNRLRFDSSVINDVCLLIRQHMRLTSMTELSRSAARRIIRDLGDNIARWLDLVEADSKAMKASVTKLNIDEVRTTLKSVEIESPKSILISPLSGAEIMELTGLSAGTVIGDLKEKLQEDVMEGILLPGDKVTAKVRLDYHVRNAGIVLDVTAKKKEKSEN